jgi:hypothetical protein
VVATATAAARLTAAEIESSLREYARIRELAEETLNAELLRQICVDPYLSWKMERIRENIRDGSHWKTISASFTVTSLVMAGTDKADVWGKKTETKLFYPRGSTVPDDQICNGPIYSYRNCTYDVHYVVLRQGGKWYISVAQSPSDCVTRCQR